MAKEGKAYKKRVIHESSDEDSDGNDPPPVVSFSVSSFYLTDRGKGRSVGTQASQSRVSKLPLVYPV